MRMGIPKEIMEGERRVAITPEVAAKLKQEGADILIEKGAGLGARYSDQQYIEAGATIMESAEALYAKADVILKVKEPQMNRQTNVHEVDLMHKGQILIAFIHPASPINHEMVRNLAAKGVTSLTLDGVPRISRAQTMDALTSMSTCAGYKGMLLAAGELACFVPQIFSATGMIKPINALVLGAGVAGLQALATIKRLGAVVYAADIRPAAVEQAQSLGAKIIDLGVDAGVAVGEGGYAQALSDEWAAKEREAIGAALPAMDIVFLSALVPSKIAPILITEEMVKMMKPGSVIVDVSIDQGGNCAVTPPGKTEVKHGVTIIGIKNIPGMLPASSSAMFSQNVYHLTRYLMKDGVLSIDRKDEIVAGILTTIDGQIVHQGAKEAMGIA